jgi:membrane protein DedA with SNARE-associated domain
LGLSLIHEDVALVAAGLMVVRDSLPAILAGLVLYVSALLGDIGIYFLGRGARQVPWLRRLVIGPNVARVREWLEQRFVHVVVLARVLPGVLFPAYVACGWFGLSLRRFLLVTAAADAVYTAGAFTVVLVLGETVLRRFGYWVWAVLALVLVVLSILRTRRPHWGLVARASAAHPFAAIRELLSQPREGARAIHRGMPAIAQLRRRVARAERIPPWLFYIPVGAYWGWLAIRYRGLTLPCAANPRLETGGFWGESKSAAMRQIGAAFAERVAPFVTHRTGAAPEVSDPGAEADRALAAMASAGLDFPIVAKPDVGWQGFGVRLVTSAPQLRDYLDEFPAGQIVILQRYVPFDGEAGVLYARRPGETAGRVVSLTLRYFAFVLGDGRTALRELIRHDERARFKAPTHLGERPLHAGMDREDLDRVPAEGEVVRLAFICSIRVGGLYRDARAEITPALSARFDAIARSMPDFHFGRFDIRFESIERLKEGEGFAIFEVNGAGAEAIHVWDPEMSLREVYRSLFGTLRLLFEMGRANRDRGARPCTFRHFLAQAWEQHRLILRYPPST